MWQTAFKKFYLGHSGILCPIQCDKFKRLIRDIKYYRIPWSTKLYSDQQLNYEKLVLK